jgi:hypothetical protein
MAQNLQQKKLLAVANALGISDLSNMQGSTGVIYDEIASSAATEYTFFKNVSSRTFPNTNLTSNRFEVNEALLIEAIAVYSRADNGAPTLIQDEGTDDAPINGLLDIVIGNKRTMKDTLVTGPAIAQSNTSKGAVDNGVYYLAPTIGIVIPPQVEFECQLKFNATPNTAAIDQIGIALYGTRVLLNLQTSL